MSNEKKTEKKAEAPKATGNGTPTPQEAAPGQPEVPKAELVEMPPPNAALVPIAKAGLRLPTLQELDDLSVAAKTKFEALTVLLGDTGLTEGARVKIQALIEQANPIKLGMEEVVTSWSVPRITLCQPTTNDPKKPEPARPGDIFTSAGQLLEKPLGVIPIYFNEENIMFTQGEKAPACSAPDAKVGSPFGACVSCVHLPFGKQNGGRGKQEKTACQNQIVVALLAADLSQVYVVQFAKTSRGAGSALIALAKAQPFPWKQSYLLSSQKEVGDLGTYYIYKIEPTGKDNTPEAHRIAKSLYELYQANRQKMLGEYYYRVATGEKTAVAAEENFVDDAKLAAGLDANRRGEEPDLSGGAAAPGPSVKSSAKPM